MIVSKNFSFHEVQTGDLIEIHELIYLVCPHPTEEFKYYLPSLNGIGVYSRDGWTLKDIDQEVSDKQGQVFSKEKYLLSLEEIR